MSGLFSIEYAVVCHKGFVRDKNQDNFWCGGIFLECENYGLLNVFTGIVDSLSRPAFAVFDGLGGEASGEFAAWLAARTFDDAIEYRFEKEEAVFLKDVFGQMNNSISDYAASQNIINMGATGAAVIFGEDNVAVCNLGDSRIYLHRSGHLARLSEDHVASDAQAGKPCLTQYLGIPENEFCIEPFLARYDLQDGDRFLLCSDGLTDMLPEEDVGSGLSREGAVHVVEELLEGALERGGKDNITIIVCTVNKNRL